MNKKIFLLVGFSLLSVGCNPHTAIPVQTSTSQVYDNSYMKVTIPAGWTVTAVSKNPAAVNITKDNYILYINTQASQASGVTGGRFAEIATGAPSADAVMLEQPSPPCGTSETSVATTNHPRVDLYINASDKKSYCAVPSTGKTVWYFSYIANKIPSGYFNYYRDGQAAAYVITMAYNSKNINSFPQKDSPTLKTTLSEMTAIIQSLQIK